MSSPFPQRRLTLGAYGPLLLALAGSTAVLVTPRPSVAQAPAGVGNGIPAARAPGSVVAPDAAPSLPATARRDPTASHSFSAAGAAFPVEVGGRTVPFRVMAVTALPGEELRIRSRGRNAPSIRVDARDGEARPVDPRTWTWRAPPEPGIHPVRVVDAASGEEILLNVLVMHPASHVEEGRLHGYEIGAYRPRPRNRSEAYVPPAGFVAVTEVDEDVLLSPHFTLGQFLCKQPGSPRYLALSHDLVVKLEAILAGVNEAGYAVPTLTVMSGFRTPAYNLAIGNKTVFSRHLWGDAADIYVDADGDGDMDDLNGDGRVNVRDADVLVRIVEAVEAAATDLTPGGVATYRRNAVHGPFVHVDARGTAARW